MKSNIYSIMKPALRSVYLGAFLFTFLASEAQANYIVLRDGESFSSISVSDYALIGAAAGLIIAIIICVLLMRKNNPWQGVVPPSPGETDIPTMIHGNTQPPKPEPVKSGLRLVLRGKLSSGEAVQASVYYSEVEAAPDQRVYIGRDSSMWFPLDDMSVSRLHAQVSVLDGQFVVSDKDSGNGTRIRGSKIPARRFVKINSGDSISFGKVELTVSVF